MLLEYLNSGTPVIVQNTQPFDTAAFQPDQLGKAITQGLSKWGRHYADQTKVQSYIPGQPDLTLREFFARFNDPHAPGERSDIGAGAEPKITVLIQQMHKQPMQLAQPLGAA